MSTTANQTEKVVIKAVSYVTTKQGQELVILHTTPCAKLKDSEGKPVERFKLNRKVFEQRAREVGKPLVIFEKQCIGASYEYSYRAVKAGEAFISGEGTYTKDHNAKVSDKISISASAQAEDSRIAMTAYYNSMFSAPANVPATGVAVSTSASSVEDGSDINA